MWVSVEGAIGGGKTTFIETVVPLIETPKRITVIPEPVEKWEQSGILERSYTDPHFKFPAQCYFFTSRIKTFREKFVRGTLHVSERSPFSDKLFWDINCTNDQELYQLYMDMWEEWQNLLPIKNPSLFIYLKASTQTCVNRMVERNRSAEKTVDVEYQKKLVEKHNQIFDGSVKMPNGTVVPCLVIDSECNFRDDPEEAKRIAKEISLRLTKGIV